MKQSPLIGGEDMNAHIEEFLANNAFSIRQESFCAASVMPKQESKLFELEDAVKLFSSSTLSPICPLLLLTEYTTTDKIIKKRSAITRARIDFFMSL